MPEQGKTSVAVGWDTKRRLDRLQRGLAARLDRQLSADDVVAHLIDAYEAQQAQGVTAP
jgi:hypothetical protein